MKPLIFLDIDGVLNGHTFDDDPEIVSNTLDPECVRCLNLLLRRTRAEIVLSSAWRYMVLGGAMTLKGFEYLLRTHGVAANNRLIGHTRSDEDVATRGEQVADWLATHGRRPYVVLDDGGCLPGSTDWSDLGLSVHPVVWTRGNTGLTEFEVSKAVDLLAAQSMRVA